MKLIEAGADVNVQTPFGDTALHNAAQRDWNDVILTLLKHGANINQKNNSGQVPLVAAVRWKNAMQTLLNAGADVEAGGEFLLRKALCATGRHAACNLRVLLEHGALAFHLVLCVHHTSHVAYAAGVRCQPRQPARRHPMKLQEMCREAICDHLMSLSRVNLFYRVAMLPLPKAIQQYLLYGESLDAIWSESEPEPE